MSHPANTRSPFPDREALIDFILHDAAQWCMSMTREEAAQRADIALLKLGVHVGHETAGRYIQDRDPGDETR